MPARPAGPASRKGDRMRRRRGCGWRRTGRWLAVALLAWVLASFVGVLALRWFAPPVSAVMLQARIAAWADGQHDFRLHQRWVPLAQIAPELQLAVIAAEDQNFPLHRGFDFGSIRAALGASAGGARLRGASTISQQVAKNLFLWNGRSWLRKGLEAWFTLGIEALWPKRRTLEMYLNYAEFGPGIYGAAAASERYFGLPPAQLDEGQAALLAAVLPNPRRLHADRPSAYVRARARWIRRQMQQLGGPDYLPR